MIVVLASLLLLLALPGTLELLVLSVCGLLRPRRPPAPCRPDPRLVAVVPAHDEELGIASCVTSLAASDPRLEIVVVADNCSDGTAGLAAAAGARVLVRHDAERRGKGFALDHAFRQLLGEGAEALLVVDADTQVDRNFVPVMRRWLRGGADAVQCRYGVLNADESLRTRLMQVALMAFNVLRPRGRARLGLSAGIFGNGFALTAETLAAVPYEASSVVEDLEYHLRLVRAGRRVAFADGTCVRALMPTGGRGADTQRARWEGGRLRMLRESAAGLCRDVLRGRWRLLEPLLDLATLPLATHVLVLGLAAAVGGLETLAYASSALGVVLLHVVAGLRVGRAGRSELAALCGAPLYVAWKLLRLPAILAASSARSHWVRTARELPGREPRGRPPAS